MKTFIIINGRNVRYIQKESMQDAITTAENTCDHSKEVIVREVQGSPYSLVVVKGGVAEIVTEMYNGSVEIRDYDVDETSSDNEVDDNGNEYVNVG